MTGASDMCLSFLICGAPTLSQSVCSGDRALSGACRGAMWSTMSIDHFATGARWSASCIRGPDSDAAGDDRTSEGAVGGKASDAGGLVAARRDRGARTVLKIAIFGLGYVGSVTAACLAGAGHDVVGVDLAEAKVRAVREGRAPLAEPGLEDLILEGVDAGRLTATTDAEAALTEADVAIICVGTPSAPSGALTTTYVTGVARQIGDFLRAHPDGRHLTVVFRSTLLPGTTHTIADAELPEPSEDRFSVVYCPEFLRESTAIKDFKTPPFTVIGTSDARALATVREVFASADGPVRHVTIPTAEAIKYASNAFHAVKITFANEMARFADAYEVDANKLMEVFVEDRILNVSERYLRPGFSFGGSCLPKDVRAVTNAARKADVSVPLLESLLPSNTVHTRRLIDHVLRLGWKEVALLGLAFKSNTDDLRESPYVEIAETLLGKGITVRIYDEIVRVDELTGSNETFVQTHLPHLARLLTRTRAEATDGADGVIIGSDRTPQDELAALAVPVLDADSPALEWPVR